MRRLLALLADPERIRPEMRLFLLALLAAAVLLWAEVVVEWLRQSLCED